MRTQQSGARFGAGFHAPGCRVLDVSTGTGEAARRYLEPLIAGEAHPPYKDGLPDYVKLQNAAAPKKLTTAFAV